jgi:short-subunit dehydrogenase
MEKLDKMGLPAKNYHICDARLSSLGRLLYYTAAPPQDIYAKMIAVFITDISTEFSDMKQSEFPPATPLQPRKRAIIIGASSGIGAALAQKMAREGYLLALLARREEYLKTLCEDINRASGEIRARYYVHDVADTKAVPALLRQIVSELGGLDVFVYNSGILLPVKVDEFDFEKDRQMLEANTLGAMAWLNPVAAMFQDAKSGTIVGVGSVAGDRGRVGAPAYNTSKAALHTYLEALRNRLTRHGVAVLTVKPGFVATAMLKASPRTFWVITPEQAAEDILKAMRARKQVIYTPARWGLLMFIIRHIPSFVFRRLSF